MAAAELSQVADTATWTGIVGGGLLGLRWLFKTFRKDVQEVQLDGEQDKLLQNWKDLATKYKAEAEENAKRADAFADERNKAIEEVGGLKGQIAALTGNVESLQQQIEIMQKTIMHMEQLLVQYQTSELDRPAASLANIIKGDLFDREDCGCEENKKSD